MLLTCSCLYRPAPLQYERYQPGFDRVLNDELPDAADPPGARWERWAAGPPLERLHLLLLPQPQPCNGWWAEPGQSPGSRQRPLHAFPTTRWLPLPVLDTFPPSYLPACSPPPCSPPACLPADGRYWVAGVAQGVSANPYERRLVTSARRKPIVVGPRSIAVVVDGEGHTLAGAVTDVAWLK